MTNPGFSFLRMLGGKKGMILVRDWVLVVLKVGKYLGVPIFHKRVTKSTFQFIINKVDQRLSAWKTCHLSYAGRVTLVKSVLQAMPSYVMQFTCIPRAVCDEIDKRCRSFIWGDSENHNKIHTVAWNNLSSLRMKVVWGLDLPGT